MPFLDYTGLKTLKNNLDKRFVTGLTVNGRNLTFVKGDGSTSTIVTQDTDTTYTAGDGISISDTTISNSGVISIAEGKASGTLSVNTGGTVSDVPVKGLGTAAYTDSISYATSGHDHDKAYLKLSGGTVTGTLVLSKTQDLSGTANNSPALIVGGNADSEHLEFDANEIHAKSNGTSAATLYINSDGGAVNIGSGGLSVNGNVSGTWNGDTISVSKGGTGATTFTSGSVLVGNGTNAVGTRPIADNTSKTYASANTNLITANTLAYWNGAYNSSGDSNLSCLGTVTKGVWNGSAVPLGYGGTGATNAVDARTSLGAASTGANTLTGVQQLKSTNITVGTVPSSAQSGNSYIKFVDNAGAETGYIKSYYSSANALSLMLESRRTIDGQTRLAQIALSVDGSGNAAYSVTNPSAFRSAIEAPKVYYGTEAPSSTTGYNERDLWVVYV